MSVSLCVCVYLDVLHIRFPCDAFLVLHTGDLEAGSGHKIPKIMRKQASEMLFFFYSVVYLAFSPVTNLFMAE